MSFQAAAAKRPGSTLKQAIHTPPSLACSSEHAGTPCPATSAGRHQAVWFHHPAERGFCAHAQPGGQVRAAASLGKQLMSGVVVVVVLVLLLPLLPLLLLWACPCYRCCCCGHTHAAACCCGGAVPLLLLLAHRNQGPNATCGGSFEDMSSHLRLHWLACCRLPELPCFPLPRAICTLCRLPVGPWCARWTASPSRAPRSPLVSWVHTAAQCVAHIALSCCLEHCML